MDGMMLVRSMADWGSLTSVEEDEDNRPTDIFYRDHEVLVKFDMKGEGSWSGFKSMIEILGLSSLVIEQSRCA
ncbi:hypothetical protein N7481_007188 [Penicillium waksmanii]|uniref:uncharacterized protein n=1 Tax=Penicillium waksmanii TaxID=69791 RepID=UPI0025487145|nr:uncharacterized protein N7481_007188 [Penicillium waksmanii]KAJ5979890.1 hypothetical protein N7481_007188 [Penicillium waksmanii]